MPYIYSLTGMVTHKNYNIMHTLIMDFGNESKVMDIGNQFMFDPAFLINLITEYKTRNRNVYLPSGSYRYELKTGYLFTNGQFITADAPYLDIPIFVKAGSIIPADRKFNTLRKKHLTQFVFSFALEKMAHLLCVKMKYKLQLLNGKYSTVELTYSEAKKEVTIGKRKAGEIEFRLTSGLHNFLGNSYLLMLFSRKPPFTSFLNHF